MGEGQGIPPAGPIVQGPNMRMPAMQTPVPEPVTQEVTPARRPVGELTESLNPAVQQYVPPALQEQVHGLVTGALTRIFITSK